MITELKDKNILLKIANQPDILPFVLKLTLVEKESIKSILMWPSDLLANVTKEFFTIFDMLAKLTPAERQLLKSVTTWSPTLISQLSKYENNFFKFLIKLAPSDLSAVGNIVNWPASLLSQLAKDDNGFFKFIVKLNRDNLQLFSSIFDWSPALFTGLIKAKQNFFDFVNRLSLDEIASFDTFLEWPAALLATFNLETSHLHVLHKMWDLTSDRTAFMKTYFSVFDAAFDANVDISDVFSSGQLDSKLWLIDQVVKLNLELGRTWTLCGWIGSLAYLMNERSSNLQFSHIRSFDIDSGCASLADMLNKPQVKNNWKFKASTLDVNKLRYSDFRFVTEKYDGTIESVRDTADTVINTSCDHMSSDDWWNAIPAGKLVILQNNNFIEIAEHVNNVFSITEFAKKYPMTDVLYQGELDCKLYTRYMLIGRK